MGVATRKASRALQGRAPADPKGTDGPSDQGAPPSSFPPAASTGQLLLQAARDEFGERGFDGTDSNKIARRAGFAPQTFYRWYRDKTAVFVAVYQAWEQAERDLLGALLTKRASAKRLVEAIVAHHREHRTFRRSLRSLAVENDVVRKARADSRLRQVAEIQRWQAARGRPVLERPVIAVVLLQVERLADAICEGELRDVKMDDLTASRALIELVKRLS